jgi:TonB-dependent starch-binding outer membrane protein SusC
MRATPLAVRSRRIPFLGLCMLVVLAGCAHSRSEPGAGVAEERISTGYATETKSSSTASVASMKQEDVRERQATRFEELLERLPGVDVVRSGNHYTVRIRGSRSILGNNDPLYVVDGRIVHSTDLITPQNVVRIDVLKDAASLAMYGSRGANGVIVVTTIHSH